MLIQLKTPSEEETHQAIQIETITSIKINEEKDEGSVRALPVGDKTYTYVSYTVTAQEARRVLQALHDRDVKNGERSREDLPVQVGAVKMFG